MDPGKETTIARPFARDPTGSQVAIEFLSGDVPYVRHIISPPPRAPARRSGFLCNFQQIFGGKFLSSLSPETRI
jgi:hypothetical protein